MAALIYKAALFAAVPDAATDNPEEAIVAKEAAGWFSPEELQALYEIALRGRRQLPYAPDEQTGFEMTLLRMTLFAPQSAAESSSAAAPAAVPVAKPPATIPEAPPISKSEELPAAAKDWPSVTAQLNETALALVRNCTLRSFDGKGVILVLDESRLNGSEHLFGHLKSELARICGKSFKLELLEGKDNAAQEARQKAAEAEADESAFCARFFGRHARIPLDCGRFLKTGRGLIALVQSVVERFEPIFSMFILKLV